MSQQRTGPPGPLFSAAKCNECWIRIAHDFHGNGLTGREKRNHVQLFMLCQGTLHLYEACFEPIDKLFGQERLVKAPGLDRGNANLGKKSQKAHLITIAENVGQRSTSNRCRNYQLEHLT